MKLVICAVFLALSVSYGMEAGDTPASNCILDCNNILNPVCATAKDTEIVVFTNMCALDFNKCSTSEKEYEQLDTEVCKEHLKQHKQFHSRSCILHLEGWNKSEKGELPCEVDSKEKTILTW